MKMSAARVKGFSDGLIAIIMTLMVLQIPLPETMGRRELLLFFKSILIYGASFIIVGGQWNRHHRLLDTIEEVSDTFMWENLIYLFLLSLVPIFMKWVIQFPSSVIPALGYSFVYLLNDFGMRILFIRQLKENKEQYKEFRQEKERESMTSLHVIFLFAGLILILCASAVLPQISIVCFIIYPVCLSLVNVFGQNRGPRDSQLKMVLQGRKRMLYISKMLPVDK